MKPLGERPPVWVAVFTCICAGAGLALNAEMVHDDDAFTLALLLATVAIGVAAWLVWGPEAD